MALSRASCSTADSAAVGALSPGNDRPPRAATARRRRRALWIGFGLVLLGPWVRAARTEPVEFRFAVAPTATEPFARELWAEVALPDHRTLRLPAFFIGEVQFAVRARAEATGEYRLGRVSEIVDGEEGTLPARAEAATAVVGEIEERRPISRSATQPGFFADASGRPYCPLGANLAWASEGRVRFHLRALDALARAHLNWTRIWMVHWSGLNLDWLPPDLGPSPARGALDLRVARDWDRIVAHAEERGVYLQLVLQHHGQYSTGTNPCWQDNPWNAANGGFLRTPEEFFTSAAARRLTALKYRYIAARWGYSPAVLAWELFNEVHWTDALHDRHDVAAVARWHAEMAAVLRAADAYHHLVTTSADRAESPVFADLDYYQVHNYASNVLAAIRRCEPPGRLDRPFFFGEFGTDHLALSPAALAAGVALVPPVWASLMGDGPIPAQVWEGERLVRGGRLSELAAVARFLAAYPQIQEPAAGPFLPVVESAARTPWVVRPGDGWQRFPPTEFELPADGREPAALGQLPANLVGSPGSRAEGFPDRFLLRVDLPRPVTARVRFAGSGAHGAVGTVRLDDAEVFRHRWLPVAEVATATTGAAEGDFAIGAGPHAIAIANEGGPDWCAFDSLDLGLGIPVLAAAGRRTPDFVAVWIWNRTGVFAEPAVPPAAGTLVIDHLPAGAWTIVWWDALRGMPGPAARLEHRSGTLRVPTPPIDRHAVVVLTR